ncbi:ABC transporter permease [Mucilaginibacter ginsenosidivorans]|uniref:FtsX-like permease family protein n=1 Tax=Mucilaginibacter ginsenosidivorans TaxID=398053 RepID=A0A5B8UYJ1_9SPHI|nr:ABC transporter permease [Mucilaginibacter ginsenosidivorans]QEC64164.1 FtsX-like permease family protein [Mucilaginibacter ginsenosidivorans]
MLKNYFKIAWRNIVRHKGYAAINVSGLTVGIAACLLIFVIIQFETSFETFRPNYKNIYHVVTQQKREEGFAYNPGVPIPSTEALRLDFPQAKVAAINTAYGSQITVLRGGTAGDAGDKKFTENMGVMFMEPQFFDIFKADWLAGNPSVLAQPEMAVIDKSSAEKYFGDWKNAVGKLLKMDNLINLKVAGVIEDAKPNSDLPLKILISFLTVKKYPDNYYFQSGWHSISSNHQVFMELPASESVVRINAQLAGFVKKHSGDKGKVGTIEFLQPLADMHFDTRFGNTLGDHMTTRASLRTMSFIAVLIIIMASINFINLSTAQSVGRSKEVGIRKVLGSSRKQLIAQVMGETAIIVVGAVILSVIAAKLALPYLKNVANVPDSISLLSIGSILFLAIVAITVILLAGIYPALVVSGFKPVLALKNKITAASIGGIPLRKSLVVGQFAISQFLIIGTMITIKQMNFVNEANLGFNKEAVLIIPGYTDSISLGKMESYKQRLLQNPAVRSASFVSDAPSSDNNWGTNFYFDNSTKENGITTFLKVGDADYFKTFGLHFAAGKGFEQSDTARQVVVNETFVAKLNIKPQDAVGKTVRLGGNKSPWLRIAGVVKDFKTNSLREAVKPIVISPAKKFESEVAIKIQTKNLVQTVAGLQKQWESTYPEYAYNGYFLDENIAHFYNQENQMALIYKIFAGIAIFISCLGLYGLVSFMVVQRTKEVGVRKVLGASISSIVYLFSKEFMILIALSFVIAVPVAWYMMTGWLQNFVYRIHISADVFFAAVLASLLLAWLTVGYKAVKAALVNPVKSLRSE